MSHPFVAAAFAIFIWWFSTGVIFVVARKGEKHEWLVAAGMTLVTLLALAGLYLSARSETVAGAYVAFGSALVVWAWHELMFLLGFVSGPRRFSATPGLKGEDRFREAFATVRDHELAIAATALLIVGLTMGGTNAVGLWTFVLLWVMRISAKLIIFLGARNSLSDMMPERLEYLTTYFRTDRTTWVLPVVLFAATGIFIWLCAIIGATEEAYKVVGLTLIVSLLALAIVEHIFLMLPFQDAVLWMWAAPSTKSKNETRCSTAESDLADRKNIKREGVSWT